MKLHLPLSLRAALLAVLASVSLVHAEKIVINDKEGTLEEKTYNEDVEIEITEFGKLVINSSSTRLSGEHTTINAYGELESRGYIGAILGTSSNSIVEATINVGDKFTNSGCIAYTSKENTTAEAVINVKDGNFIMSGGRIAEVYNDYSVISKSTAKATINMTDWGQFTMSGGSIAYVYATGTGSQNLAAETTINVTDHSVFTMDSENAHISYAYATGSSTSGITVEATINVNDGKFTMKGGDIAYAYVSRSSATAKATINVENGTFSMQYYSGSVYSRIAYAAPHNSIGNPATAIAEATINVKKDGIFSMNDHNDIAYAVTSATGSAAEAKVTINVEDGGKFIMSGGSIATISGTTNATVTASAEATINVAGTFDYQGGTLGNVKSYTLKGQGLFDMHSNSVSFDIYMQGGQLSNASKYTGNLTILSADDFTGNIQLGGVAGRRIQQLRTKAGVTVSGMTGALTIHQGDYMYVGAGSIGAVGSSGGETPMLSFSESGSIAFADLGRITLYFDEDAFDDISRDASGKASFEIYFTDGELSESVTERFKFGSDYSDFEITDIQDGKLIVNGTLPEIESVIWKASENVDEESGLLIEGSGKMPGKKYSEVVVDRDAHLTIAEATLLNELHGTNLLDLKGKGEVTLHIATETRQYSGTISTVADVSLEKTGKGTLDVTGKLAAGGAVTVSEGTLKLSGATHSIGSLAMKDGSLELGSRSALTLTDASTQSGGAISGGSIVLEGTGASYKMSGGEINNSSISLSQGATFTQGEKSYVGHGSSSSVTITISGAGSEYTLEGGKEGLAYVASLGSAEIKIEKGGKFTQGDWSYMGYGASGSVAITVSGTGSEYALEGKESVAFLASTGTAEIKIEKGGKFTHGDKSYVGHSSSGNVDITISGTGSEYTMEGKNYYANLAYLGGAAEIKIEDGGKFIQGDKSQVAADGSASISITGEDSVYEMNGGYLGKTDGTADIKLTEGGAFTQSGGAIAGEGTSISISDKTKATTFTQSGGTLTAGDGISLSGAKASFAQSGGTISDTSLTLSEGASFTQSKAGSIEGKSTIDLKGSSTFTQSGGSVAKGVSITLNDSSKLTLQKGATMAADVTLKGAGSTYDLGSQTASGSITMNGGKLEHAENFGGSLSIAIGKNYTADTSIDLGGAAANTITHVNVATEGVGISGLKSGSTLTLTDADNSLSIDLSNTNYGEKSGTALILFENADGTVSFTTGGSIALNLEIDSAFLRELESQTSFNIHLTNGTIGDWYAGSFVIGGVWNKLGYSVISVEGGDLIIHVGDLSNSFLVSRDAPSGVVDDPDELAGLEDKDAVLMDDDLELNIGSDFDGDHVTLNDIQSIEDDTDLNINNNTGGDLDVNLNNDTDTTLKGDLTVKSGKDSSTDLNKTGEGTLTVEGTITTDGDLNVKEGGLEIEDKEGNGSFVGGDVTVGDSEAGTSGSLVVDGDMDIAGSLDIQDGDVTLNGDDNSIGGDVSVGKDGSLTTGEDSDLEIGGGMDIDGGDVSLGGNTTVEEDVTVKGGGSLEADGDMDIAGNLEITDGDVTLDGDDNHIGGNVTVGDSENGTSGSLSSGGNMDIEGDLDIENGDVTLDGDDNHIGGNVTVGDAENGTSGSLSSGGNLDIEGDLDIENGDVKLEGDNNRVGGDLHLGNEEKGTDGNLEIEGSLTVEGDVDLSEGRGSITGDGELHIGEDGSLKMGDNVDIDGPSLSVDGELDMSGVQDPTLGGLGGSGSVNAGDDADITIDGTGGDFSGSLEGSGSITVKGDGTNQSFTDVDSPDFDLTVKDGGTLTLTESTFGSAEAKKDGNLEFRAKGTGAKDNGGANVTLTGNLIFRNGSTTILTLNMNADELWKNNRALMVSAGTIYIERGAQFRLNTLQDAMPEGRKGDLTNVLVMRGGSIAVADEFPEEVSAGKAVTGRAAGESLQLELAGLFYLYYENATLTVQGNDVLLSATYRQNAPGSEGGQGSDNNKPGLLEQAAQGDRTAQAGGALLDHADLAADPTLSAVGEALGNMLAEGKGAQAARVMAAVAGSTVTSLGAAQRDATRGELLRLRSYANAQLPAAAQSDEIAVHTWIEGNAAFNKLSSDGYLSGYTHNTWGGTVGAAIAPSKDVLLGLALSAQYGDLEATAADTAKGDLDGYYLSFFAHVQDSEWGHTFIATVGKHDATLNRVVDYGEGSYRTQGATDGFGIGAVYELTYDIALEEDKSSILQPLVSVSIVSTSMGAYSESGANGAGLNVDKQTWTTSSLSLGARWLARVDDSIFGGSVYTELRAALTQDLGDTEGSANVALQANPRYRREVKGTEIGSTGLQLGAGLALPLSRDTYLYMNANADLRNNSTTWSASAGIRISF